MTLKTQYVFNKNTRECNPWYPQLDIIRPHHPELVFGIPADLALRLNDHAFAEKWLRTANIANGNYVPGGGSAPVFPTPGETGLDKEADDVPPEFDALGGTPSNEQAAAALASAEEAGEVDDE